MKLGEFREATKHLSDDTNILVIEDNHGGLFFNTPTAALFHETVFSSESLRSAIPWNGSDRLVEAIVLEQSGGDPVGVIQID